MRGSRRLSKPGLLIGGIVAALFLGGLPSQAAGTPTGVPVCETDDQELPTASTPLVEIEATQREIFDALHGLPGFVDVYYYPGDERPFRPMFVAAVPAEAHAYDAPVPLAFDVIPQEPDPMGPGPVPTTSDLLCSGIRPGVRIVMGGASCTANWIFTNGNDKFLGTAGHCTSVGQSVIVVGVGTVGTTVFSINQGVGKDFALIKLNANVLNLVSAEMCDFAGPTGIYPGPGILGRRVHHTGHGGVAFGNVPPQPKTGAGLGFGVESINWAGAPVPGDSGSPVRIDNGQALGVLTHSIGIGLGAVFVPLPEAFGTRLSHAMSLSGINNLQLVTVDYVHL